MAAGADAVGDALAAGVRHLAAQDDVARGLVERFGPPPRRVPTPPGRRFEELVRSIVHQQLAGKAAAAIHARLVAGLGGSVTVEAVLDSPPDLLRACGLSASKAAAVSELAGQVRSGALVLATIGRLRDEQVVVQLTQVRGIGRWTAEMFLLGALARPDVWPVGDFGVRAGYAAAWGLADPPSAAEMRTIGLAYQPYRSLLAWYCWRAADERPAAARVRPPHPEEAGRNQV